MPYVRYSSSRIFALTRPAHLCGTVLNRLTQLRQPRARMDPEPRLLRLALAYALRNLDRPRGDRQARPLRLTPPARAVALRDWDSSGGTHGRPVCSSI